MKHKYIEEQWADYAKRIPPAVSAEQRRVMRQFFFGGAAVLYYIVMNFLDPGTEPTDSDLAKMEALHDEIESFMAEAKAEVQRASKESVVN